MSRGNGAASRRPAVTLLLLLTMAALPACKEVEAEEAEGYQPAQVAEPATDGTSLVTFTQEGADRVDLQLERARRDGARTAVPYAALIYDGEGDPWVYTNPEPLTFRRTAVVVDRVEGPTAYVSKGLRPGTRIVTVGATEVYGAELDIAGSH